MARGRPVKGQTFWDRLDNQSVYDDNDCKLFMGARDGLGYGWVMKEGKQVLIHREVFKKYNPDVDITGFVVMHQCDQRNCINPEHLKRGTQKENVHDMIAKGRKASTAGSKNSQARLTEKKVLEIRELVASGMTRTQIAKDWGFSISAIGRAASGKYWTHVK